MSLAKYCEPHVSYRQLIDLGNVFDYDSSEVWKLKRQKDRDVINDEFLSPKIREKWFLSVRIFDERHLFDFFWKRPIRFIYGPHSTMLIAMLESSKNVSKYEDEFRKKNNINNKKCLDILFEYYGVTDADYDELFMSDDQILYDQIAANSRT